MTLEELKKHPLRRNQPLFHITMGVVAYRGKVQRKPEKIRITYINLGVGSQVDLVVNLADVEPQKKARARQGTNLFLCICEHCELKIRVARKWLDTGKPRCFNKNCPSAIYNDTPEGSDYRHGDILHTEYGENGGAILGMDMKQVGHVTGKERHGLSPGAFIETGAKEENEWCEHGVLALKCLICE
jgi:hypothetical protein